MSRERPLVWSDVALMPESRALLQPHASVVDVQRTREHLPAADAVIASSVLGCDSAFFASAPRVLVVARVGIGYDRIDVAAATAAGVVTVNTPEAPTESTAEFAIAMMLALSRRITLAAQLLPAGQWSQGPDLMGTDLAEKRLGLIGCGRIGRRVAEIALAFRMRVFAYDPSPAPLPAGVERVATLDELLGGADILSLHVPLTAATRHLLGRAQLARVKQGALVINTARGPTLDQTALLEALHTGKIGGAAIDVWDPEPPQLDNALLRHPHLIATPHIAAFTKEGRTRSHCAAAEHVLAVLAGRKPDTILNPEVWPRRRIGLLLP